MARVFTTSFEFNHQRYDAIVTIIRKDNQLNFTVKLLDLDLHDVFPDGRVNYCSSNGFAKLNPGQNTLSHSVMKKLGAAINKHLLQTA